MLARTMLAAAILAGAPLLTSACSDDTSAGAQCGTTTCSSSERCCGPPACGSCVDKNSRVACPATCPGSDAATDGAGDSPASDGPPGQSCGGKTCTGGSFCCGPPACGFCAPANSGVFCPPSCPDAAAADAAAADAR